MGNIMLKYVEAIKVKGRTYYYYRRNKRRVSLPCDPSTPEFNQRYHELNSQFETGKTAVFEIGTIGAMITLFKASSDYNQLKPRVRKLYSPFLDLVQEKLGRFQAKGVTRNVIMVQRDKFQDMPAKANNFIRVISRLYSFGIDRNLVTFNPATKIKKLKIGEYRPWTDNELAAFLRSSGESLKLSMALAVYTGQRLGDIIKMRWNQIDGNEIEVVQEKTGELVWIPLHRTLRDILKNVKRKSVMILTSSTGLPYKHDHLKHQFKAATIKAGLPDDLVFHGLRKTAAVRLAEAGCTTEQIKAITGHKTSDMVEHYTKGANQKKLARAAISKLEVRK